MKRLIEKGIEKELGHEAAEMHFKPTYDPWDQRLCLVPDADLSVHSEGRRRRYRRTNLS